jgi:Protein of unknown function (DUF3748)
MERQLTSGPKSHNLTNTGVWSPDSEWIVYDTRFGERGAAFDGETIEAVNVATGETRTLYQSSRGAHCGVVTWHPKLWQVAFILGPENPTPEWQYSFCHRQGVLVDWESPGKARNLDARNLVVPFTAGALRGGSHVHVWEARGEWVSYTYNDAIVESDVRDVAVCVPGRPVHVPSTHERNHDGEYYSVLVSKTTSNPRPGSDEIKRACEEGWVGNDGYLQSDGLRQQRALAFQGTVVLKSGESMAEVFIVDLPDDLTRPGDGPLAGTVDQRPSVPHGVTQRRLTYTANRKFPGLRGVRHWLRSSPDGARIAFLMHDDAGVTQLWTVTSKDGVMKQLTDNPWPVASAFTWSPDGRHIAHVMDNSVFVTHAISGQSHRLTERVADSIGPLAESCVYSPDGNKIALMRRVSHSGIEANQVCVVFI